MAQQSERQSGLERVSLPTLNWKSGAGIATVDYDNDGWIDLVAVGEGANGGEIRLLRNLGGGNWTDATKDAALDSLKLSANRSRLLPSDITPGPAGKSICWSRSKLTLAPLLLKNHGAEKNSWMQIDLKALNDNKSAIRENEGGKLSPACALSKNGKSLELSGLPGTKRLAGSRWFGRGEKGADVVRLLWPTGVPQDEIRLDGRKNSNRR